jgi:hypothetical protein
MPYRTADSVPETDNSRTWRLVRRVRLVVGVAVAMSFPNWLGFFGLASLWLSWVVLGVGATVACTVGTHLVTGELQRAEGARRRHGVRRRDHPQGRAALTTRSWAPPSNVALVGSHGVRQIGGRAVVPVARRWIGGAALAALVLVIAAGCSSRTATDGSEGLAARQPAPRERRVTPRTGGRPLDLSGTGWLGLRWGMSPEDAGAALGRAGVALTREESRVAIFATDAGPADVPMDHIQFDRDGWRVTLDFVGFRLGRASLGRQVSGAVEAERVLRDLESLYGAPSLRQDVDCHQQPLRATWSVPGTQISATCSVFDSGWSVGQTVETVPQTPFGP